MILALAVSEYPDELEADFWRVYGRSWREMGVIRAAVLTTPLTRRPECELCRVLHDGWEWFDPLYALVATAVGLHPPEETATREAAHHSDGVSVTTDVLDTVLARPRH